MADQGQQETEIKLASLPDRARARFVASKPEWESGGLLVEFAAGYDPTSLGGEGYVAVITELLLSRGPVSMHSRQRELVRRGEDSKAIVFPPRRNVWLLRFSPEADVEVIAEELERHSEVVIDATPEPRAHPPFSPENEQLVGTGNQPVPIVNGIESQWYLFRCGVVSVWSQEALSGNGVVIADIDWGFLTSHVDLKQLELANAYNAYDGSSEVGVGPDTYHGTAVAGLAVAGDNDTGMAGIAFRAALWPIQANTGNGAKVCKNPWEAAIDWVRNRDSKGRRKIVILEAQTSGLRNYEEHQSVNDAIRDAVAENVVVCVPAGNGAVNAGLSSKKVMIQETGSILVAATDLRDARASLSNWGLRIAASAPGEPTHDVTCSASARKEYVNEFGGTSGAAPKVAGVVALMLEANPALTVDAIKEILRKGPSVKTDLSMPVGGAFLNAGNAVKEAIRRRRRLHLFVQNNGGTVFHYSRESGRAEGEWTELGAHVSGCVAAWDDETQHLNVFGQGSTDGALWWIERTAQGRWGGWRNLGGKVDSLSVAYDAKDHPHLFVSGWGALWHVVRDEGEWREWLGWRKLGESIGEISAVRAVEGNLEVFGLTAEGKVWHTVQNPADLEWLPRKSLGIGAVKLKVGVNTDGRFEIFTCARDGTIAHRWRLGPQGEWSEWNVFDRKGVALEVIRDFEGRLHLFAVDNSTELWRTEQVCPNSDRWKPWSRVTEDVTAIAGARRPNGLMEIFVRSRIGRLDHIGQTGPEVQWDRSTMERFVESVDVSAIH